MQKSLIVNLDTLEGGLGDDVYIFNGNFGWRDRVTKDLLAGYDIIKFTDLKFADVNIYFSEYVFFDVYVGEYVNHINFIIESKLNPSNFVSFDTERTGTYLEDPDIGKRIEAIEFSDGFVLNVEDFAKSILEKTKIYYTGTDNDETITGNSNNNYILGYNGNDILDGGFGSDTLIGGLGNDTYVVDDVRDVVTENVSEGTDLIQSSLSYTLGANVENLTLTGTAAINGTGNTLNNIIIGNAGNNILNGGTGVDTLVGGLGNDTYVVDNVGDVVTESASAGTDLVQSSLSYTLGANVENLTLTGTSAINGTGNTLNNIITGNSGNNILNGGAGNDKIDGGAGTDTAVFTGNSSGYSITKNTNGSVSVVLISAAATNTDLLTSIELAKFDDITIDLNTIIINLVTSNVTYTLPSNVQNLTLTGTAAINGTGNALNNIIIGNSANNTLNGGTGVDTLMGGAGNDTYVVDNIGDIVTENVSAGTDLIQSSVTYTLATNVENLTLTGTAAINGTGNTLNNTIIGNAGANTLNGGAGADKLNGGAGNDTYVVDNLGDVVTESASAGTDTVQSSLTHTLATNVENLTLTGTTAINGTGNTLNNIIRGNSANNTLNGGAGADTLIGGLGNDTYVVDNVGDIVTEGASAGTDLVQSSVTYTLGTNVENLTLTGTAAINGTGNTLNNVITGNAGNNILNGGAGADTLIGGLGNDTYVVDNVGDVVTESTNAGTDLVQSSITQTLATNVENLTLTGTAAINGTGNTLNNVITGNSGANTLIAGAGNDTIRGASGADKLYGDVGNDILYGDDGLDTLFGGAGADVFMFTKDSAFKNIDIISDFKTSELDKINIKDLLQGYDPVTKAITDFVQITTSGASSILKVDADGGANNFVHIATLSNITGLTDEAALVKSGHLVV